jgi:hypothetical protein
MCRILNQTLLKHPPRGLKDEGLRRMKSCKLGCPSRVVGQPGSHHCVGASEKVTRLFEEQGSFRLHVIRCSITIRVSAAVSVLPSIAFDV